MIADLLFRSVISGTVATALYLLSAAFVSRFWTRGVNRDILRHDIRLGVGSLAFGSPIIQLFSWASQRYHFGQVYLHIADRGWLYWVISLPLYVLCWDAVFYLTHLILHTKLVYRGSHFRHHACRPPVPWSGIAIDSVETIFSGLLPYTVPLFFFPFHIYTVYALNIGLMFWAMLVHSSYDWSGNAVMLSPKDHNLHHTFGLKNSNFAAVFTFWDRIGGTLNRRQSPPWWGKAGVWTPTAGAAALEPTRAATK